MEANATCCLLQNMQQGFGLGGGIYQQRYIISVSDELNISLSTEVRHIHNLG